MRNLFKSLSLVLLLLTFLSCKKSTTQSTTNMRFINLSPNSNTMDVYANNALVVGGVSYGASSSYQTINAAATSMSIKQTGTSNILLSGTIALNANSYYSVIVYDSVANLKGDIINDDRTMPPAGKTYIRFFDYVSGTSSIDIIRAGSTSNKLFASRIYLDHNNASANYTGYTAFDPGPFSVSAVVAGTNVLITQLPSFEAAAGKSYTLVLKGFSTGTGTQAVFLGPISDQ